MKQLLNYDIIMMRGAQGSGKSTTAKKIKTFLEKNGKKVKIVEADNFFMKDGVYDFNPTLLGNAHKVCQSSVKYWNSKGYTVIVANTNTSKRDFEAYQKISNNLCAVLCTGNYENLHNVPAEKVEATRMKCNIPIDGVFQLKDVELNL